MNIHPFTFLPISPIIMFQASTKK